MGMGHLGCTLVPMSMGARDYLMESLNPMSGVGVGSRPYGGPQAVARGAGVIHRSG